MNGLKKLIWMLLAIGLPLGFCACSDDDSPQKGAEIEKPEEEENGSEAYQDVRAYANFFSFNVMSDIYLWSQDIGQAFESWEILTDPIQKVADVRYKNELGEEVDKWTMLTDDYASMVGSTEGVSTSTYGCNYKFFYKDENSEAVVAFVTFTYPDSPAEEAGLKRGDVILEIEGKELDDTNYIDLYNSSSMTVGIGSYEGEGVYSSVKKEVSMNAKAMYEDPVLMHKVFDCGGKKVGYLVYTSFTFDSCYDLVDVCRDFKQQGVTELILDLRYNGGGYVFTENVLASMLAPEAEVNNGSVFQTEVWNDDYMAYYQEAGEDLNTYFATSFKNTFNNKEYSLSTSGLNLGLHKIYALVDEGTASASESILVGLMPYMDIEVIGGQTHGKYCSGVIWDAIGWYEDVEKTFKENRTAFAKEYPEYADWKKYMDNWGIYVMISRYADKDGNNPCMPNGLKPEVEAYDMFEEPYPLGDEREAMLRVALQRAGKTDLPTLAQSRAAVHKPLKGAIKCSKNPLDGKRIHTGDRMKPRIPMQR